MYRRFIISFVLAFMAFAEAWSQYDVAFSHYFVMEPSFNPAAVGKESKINVTAAYNRGAPDGRNSRAKCSYRRIRRTSRP